MKEGLANGTLNKAFHNVASDDAIAHVKAAIEAKTWTCEVVASKAAALDHIKQFIPKVRQPLARPLFKSIICLIGCVFGSLSAYFSINIALVIPFEIARALPRWI